MKTSKEEKQTSKATKETTMSKATKKTSGKTTSEVTKKKTSEATKNDVEIDEKVTFTAFGVIVFSSNSTSSIFVHFAVVIFVDFDVVVSSISSFLLFLSSLSKSLFFGLFRRRRFSVAFEVSFYRFRSRHLFADFDIVVFFVAF